MSESCKDPSSSRALPEMCSVGEIEFRMRVHDVHPLESSSETKSLPQDRRVPDRGKMVKKFSRSSGESTQFEVRDIKTLDFCIEYLESLWDNPELDTPRESYEFVMDRMRAVLVDLLYCIEPARTCLYIKILRIYLRMFWECMTHHFVSPATYTFDRTLHTREIAKVVSSLLSNHRQLFIFPSEVGHVIFF